MNEVSPLDHRAVGRIWDRNADAWTELARAGYDICRDGFNTPGFLAMLPNVAGLYGLDVGCGEGHNTRQVADRGATMEAVDVSPRFIEHAQRVERDQPRGIAYHLASAVDLPFADETFDFATAFMSLMDIPENDLALAEIRRVVKVGGFLQFSITHPCTDTPHRQWHRDEHGHKRGLEIGDYFDRIHGRIERWSFGAAPQEVRDQLEPFAVPRFHRTLSDWFNTAIDAGWRIEHVGEPRPDEEAVARIPKLHNARLVPYFLHLRCRKPSG